MPSTLDQAPRGLPYVAYAWYGDLIGGNRDGSGQKYMRNRYYDPAKGTFSQADPIGLAGGINLYGYAGGDPVNYSDPFGLCPTGPEKCTWFGNIMVGFHAGVQGPSVALSDAVDQESFGFKWGKGVGIIGSAIRTALTGIGAEALDPQISMAAGQFLLPGQGKGWTKMRGNQGWRDADGNFWKKDMKHKDHWDISDRKGNQIREVDYDGNQLWPDGPKNRNKP